MAEQIELIVGSLEHQLHGLPVPGPECVYAAHIEGPGGGDFHIIVKGGYGEVKRGMPAGGANCTITASTQDAIDLMSGRLTNVLGAVMTGRIRIAGDMAAAVRMGQLLRPKEERRR